MLQTNRLLSFHYRPDSMLRVFRFILGFIIVATFSLSSQSAHADTLKKIRDSGSITIAHRESSTPFSFFDADKKPMGFAMDLCAKVLDAVKRDTKLPKLKVNYLAISASDRLPVIKDGRADLECGNTTNTPARRNDVDFAITTFVAAGRVMSLGANAPNSLVDMSGKKIAVSEGSTYEKLLKFQNEKYGANILIVTVKDNAEAFAAVQSGKAQGWMNDDTVLYASRAQAPDPAKLSISERSLTIEPLAIMFRKDDANFKRVVNGEIRRLMAAGEFEEIYNKWFLNPIPPKNFNLNVAKSRLLKEFMSSPSDSLPTGY
jgi:ABC-type amino acid transport substrate-binding protein